jgi:acylphosphatase
MGEASSKGEAAGRNSFRALVSGQVQGVGFRFFVVREGRRLGLDGQVRNLDDGRVEVYAAGPRPDLEQLHQKLRHGPPASRVQSVHLEWGVPVSSEAGFQIGF